MNTYRLTTDMDPEIARWIGSGIPRALRGLTVDELDRIPADAIKAAQQWLEGLPERQRINEHGQAANRSDYGQGLLITGDPGSGKSSLAVAVASDARRAYGMSLRYYELAEYVDDAKVLAGSKNELEEEELGHLLYRSGAVKCAELLVLDDVGYERTTGSGYAQDKLARALRGRHRDGLPTIVVTSLTGDEVTEKYSRALQTFMAKSFARVLL
ncbi:ATP-binding protein [Streptomyces sp. NPDC059411]|uniref:ATP-binding protein n=1 Tax=Streptomyces sp. NPDC059411 TaxID=3346825 RepID=UPI0036D10023